MNRKDYNVKVNGTVLSCWALTILVVMTSSIIGYSKGSQTFAYLMIFFVLAVVPFMGTYIVNRYWKGQNLKIKYIVVVSYLVFYTFMTLTAVSNASFMYLIPMVFALCVYADKKLVRNMYQYAFFLNVFRIMLKVSQRQITEEKMAIYGIQIVTLVLSGIFLYKTTKLIEIENTTLFELSEGIEKDSLTGAYNRYFFSGNIDKMFKLAEQQDGLSMAFIDVDNFREFNTSHGHECGDEVLKSLAEAVNEALWGYPYIYLIRMGGDEFIVTSTEYAYEKFQAIVEKIKQGVDKLQIQYQEKHVTIDISIGVANAIHDKCEDYLELYRLADKRLYEAKDNGKNQIVCMSQQA